MLSYIYSDELLVENDINLLFYLLYATKKYILPRLTQICVEYLKVSLFIWLSLKGFIVVVVFLNNITKS